MIIDFTIENFRSIKEPQLFSLHAETPKQHLAGYAAYPAGDKIGVLRSAGIYGANASGKSNVLLAFRALRYIACESGDLKAGAPIPCYEPFRLSAATRSAPVRFEIEFFNTDKLRYVYSVAFNDKRILEEALDYFPTRQKANLFTRRENDTWETIAFGGRYKGGVKRIPFFGNNSYLAKAGENAGAAELIRSVYQYLRGNLIVLDLQATFDYGGFFDSDKDIDFAATFLSHVDTGIVAVEKRINDKPIESEFIKAMPKVMRELVEKRTREQYWFSHQTEEGGVEKFPQEWESDGTQRLFYFLPMLEAIFGSGGVLILDEIEKSLHPHIVEMIIHMFNDPGVNTHNAQLIFSTHSMGLMASDKMRRDQIWFADKKDGKTTLYSLDEFDKNKVKSNSPFPGWYNDGRFDAVPQIDLLAIANLLRPKSDNSTGTAEGDHIAEDLDA